MTFFVEHAIAISIIMLAILALYLLEHIFRTKRKLQIVFASANFSLHIVLVALFILWGATMEELLAVLLLSLSAGIVKAGVTEK